jgi:hypothetical protein
MERICRIGVTAFYSVALLSYAQAFGQNAKSHNTIADSVRKAWKERSDKVEGFEFVCSLIRAESAEAAAGIFAEKKPNGPIELKQSFTFIRKGKKLRVQTKVEEWNLDTQSPMNQTCTQCFDGTLNTMLLESDISQFPGAMVDNNRQTTEVITKNVCYTPLYLSLSAADMLDRLNFKTPLMTASSQPCECHGKRCIELILSRDGINSFVYVDPSRAYVPMRMVEMRGPNTIHIETEFQYDKNDVVGWALSSWVSKLYGGDGEVETILSGHVEKVSINGPINDSAFDITFPVRTRVQKTINGVTKLYIQDADGKLREVVKGAI